VSPRAGLDVCEKSRPELCAAVGNKMYVPFFVDIKRISHLENGKNL
jgi:hypothetical protein